MEEKLKFELKLVFSESQDIMNKLKVKCKEIRDNFDRMEEFYLAKLGGKSSKKTRLDSSNPAKHSTHKKAKTEQQNSSLANFSELPMDSTFTIKDFMTSTAKNVLDEPMEVNNNFMTAKKAVRVKKGNGDGTPVTSKSGGKNEQESTNLGAKPKKLMDITNIDSHDETFKIPMNPVTVPKGALKSHNKTFSYDDVSIDDWNAEDISEYPKWCLHLKRCFEKQYFAEREVIDTLFISYPIVINNPAEIFPHSNEEFLARSRSSAWEAKDERQKALNV